ncbi:MAG: prenyltransferase/squalene oxidase repeat-containing protein [Candidatus Hodarchaeales archaeon]
MMKKQYSLFLLFLLLIPIVNSSNLIIDTETNTKTVSVPRIHDSLEIRNSIGEYDPRGYLTGRIFFKGLVDSEPDGTQDMLQIDVEVNITQTLTNPIIVFALLYDNSFIKTTSQSGYMEGMEVWGSSGQESLSIGAHNVTVSFNATTLRILRLAGPYEITNVKLGEVGVDFFSELNCDDWQKPLFKISKVFDVWTFDEPNDDTSNFGTIQEVSLTNETLRLVFTFTSYDHPGVEDYYINVVLRNGSGDTIVNYGKTVDLEPNTEHWIYLDIPAKYISAFKTRPSAFTSNNLRFEELTIIQLTGSYDPFSDQSLNFSYAKLFHEETSLDPNSVTTPVNVLHSGEYIDFGLLELNENRSIIVYGEQLTQILKLQINRTEPPDNSGPNFEFRVNDGFFRERDIWDNDPSSTWILWRQFWDKTEVSIIYHQIGQYHGAIEFWVKYPDYGWPDNPQQKLEVKAEIINDTASPIVNIYEPTTGADFQQYYGIPIKGSGTDDSFAYEYQLVFNNKVQLKYRPFTAGWWMPGPVESGEFSFVWFPDESILGSITISIRVIDMVGNVGEALLDLTINSGTKPSPEGTIAKGLEWLKDRQAFDGSWDYNGWSSSGMTALAALCFIQAGLTYDPVYQPVLDKAIDYLMNAFEDSDEPGVPGKVIRQSGHATYETAMAVTALIAYNATRPTYEADLNNIINGAIDWLVVTQNDETWGVTPDKPYYGGWRYGYDHQSSDLSVSQWVFLALSTYGYDDPDLWNKVKIFVNRCRGGYEQEGTWYYDGGFSYTPSTEDWRDFGGGSYGSMTAAGIWGLYLSGEPTNNENITSALDWISSLSPEEIVGQNPHFGKSFEYYWYLSASKAYLMAGRPQDKWWYDLITEYLNTHMIATTTTSAYWDNSMGEEPPVMATVQAILSQQVFYGHAPMERLEISVDSPYGSVLTVWNDTWSTGFNHSTGEYYVYGDAQTSEIDSKQQVISIFSPTKGEYFVDLFPTATKDGFPDQGLILRARALTKENNLISYKTKYIDYQYAGDSPQVLRFKLVYSTVSGVNLEFIDVNPPLFNHLLQLTSLSYPEYVDRGESFNVDFSIKHIASSTLETCLLHLYSTLTGDQNQAFSLNPNEEKSFSFTGTTLPNDTPGIKTIVITLAANDTNPLVIRCEIQIGNHAPQGEFGEIPNSINGTFNVTWSASDDDNDSLSFVLVLWKPDGDKVNLTITTDLYYLFDSTAYPDGSGYGFELIISDGIDVSSFNSLSFTINNQPESTTVPTLATPTPGLEFFFSLLALFVFVRKHPKT